MVWGGFSYHHRTPLIPIEGNLTAQRYIDEVLDPEVVPFFQQHQDLTTFQQDNARPHAARQTIHFLHAEGMEVLPWPAYSPDLNPIEHLWDQLGRRVGSRLDQPTTRARLIQLLQEEWNLIPQECLRRLIRSMRDRCRAVIDAGGGHTRY